jgi:hypothetical protein
LNFLEKLKKGDCPGMDDYQDGGTMKGKYRGNDRNCAGTAGTEPNNYDTA